MATAGHVVVAPDKFKGTLTAPQAAAHIAAGLTAARPGLEVQQVPVADGGDGTVVAALAAGYRAVPLTVRGPTGRPVRAELAWRDGTAIIEAAQASGLARLPGGRPEPLTATSFGVGELVAAALARGARRIVLGLGGVASSDGGAGLVQALGGRLLDSGGRDLPPGGAALAALHHLDLTALTRPPGTEVLIASDVDNPLLGEHGAAAVYGPQKGAAPGDVAKLEAGLTRWADLLERAHASPARAAGPGRRARDEPGAGAAGGLGFAALVFLGARVRPGIELMLDLLSFTARLDGARLVVTGEGSLDAQTLRGKAPAGVARAAAAAPCRGQRRGLGRRVDKAGDVGAGAPHLPVVAVAGRCTLSPAELRGAGLDAAYALTGIEPDPARCLAAAGPLLERLSRRVADDWLPAVAPPAGASPGTLSGP